MGLRLSRFKLAPTLQEFCAPERGKDNNFNLLRLLAAFAVLFGHCYALLGQAEPLGATLGMSIGSIAVDIFFISSGFLVGASLIQRQSIVDYVLARFLRIFPALWVMLLIVVLILGAALSGQTWSSYYHDPRIVQHLAKSASLMTGLDFYLPGLFADNPFPHVVNGSLWTMVYELCMYGLLLLMWIVYRLGAKRLPIFVASSFVLAAGYCAYQILAFHYILEAKQLGHLSLMFFSGTLYYLARRWIPLHPIFSVLSMFVLGLCLVFQKNVFEYAYFLVLPYLVFSFAYLPTGLIRQFNRGGDYSYGVYIYAFPLQQAVIAMTPGIDVTRLLLISGTLTLFCAALSWHLIEKPVMAQRWKLLSFLKVAAPR
jgi:peptidoglycan/LPS O-acetylase OafA/YrhL